MGAEMTFTLDAQVAAVLAAAIEQNGPPPAPPVGDVASRRVALDAIAFDADVSRRAQSDRDRVLRSL
jgi:hypothetical protein